MYIYKLQTISIKLFPVWHFLTKQLVYLLRADKEIPDIVLYLFYRYSF